MQQINTAGRIFFLFISEMVTTNFSNDKYLHNKKRPSSQNFQKGLTDERYSSTVLFKSTQVKA